MRIQSFFNSQQRIDTWRPEFEQKTICVFFLPVDPRNEDHREPDSIDYSVPRRARYVQNTFGKGIRTRKIGLILILELSKKD